MDLAESGRCNPRNPLFDGFTGQAKDGQDRENV
jgi:hypothetical protein